VAPVWWTSSSDVGGVFWCRLGFKEARTTLHNGHHDSGCRMIFDDHTPRRKKKVCIMLVEIKGCIGRLLYTSDASETFTAQCQNGDCQYRRQRPFGLSGPRFARRRQLTPRFRFEKRFFHRPCIQHIQLRSHAFVVSLGRVHVVHYFVVRTFESCCG
jgi:hypothetical protein